MAAEHHEPESMHEFRLEGIGLLLGGGLLLALMAGAFFLGRWVERGAQPAEPQSVSGSGPLTQVLTPEPDADVGQGVTHFDDLEGAEKQPEPAREIPPPKGAMPAIQPVSSRPSPAASSPGAQADEKRYYVQVSALRDQSAAVEVIDTLKAQGYGVRLFSEREGQGMLYKVRVGGYATDREARAMAVELRKAGYAGAWVATD